MMPSVSPFEGGICCINKSDNQSSISSPSISTVVSSAWPSPDEEVDGGPDSNNHHQSSAVQDSTGEEDSDYFTSMCCDDLLTYTAVSVVQPHHRPMMMMTTMMPSTGVLGDGLMSSTSHHQASAAAVADYMAQQLLPIGTASAAVQLHQHQQQQHNSSTSSTATKTIPLFLDDPLCDGDDQNNGGLTENGPIKNEIVDSSCKSSITDDWTNKNPSDWTQDDAIAWLFTTAKEGGVPEGVITATNNHPPLVDSGAQLARMSLSDYRQKYGPEYGVVFYRAFRQILAVQQHHQMLVNNGPSSQHHHHQMMTGSNDLTNLQNFSAGMQQQHHYQNNNGCSWSTTNMSSLESDSYQHQQQQNNNNLIIPDQQQHHLVEMLNGYDTIASAGGSISRQHHQQQQLFSSGMDCSNPYNGQHQSAQIGNGLNYMQQQHHQLNNNINAKYGADPIHQHHQHQQDGYYPNNCYSSLDGIIGGDHMEFPESYSNGTPSDPDEIGSTLNGSESGCNSISGATHQHNHLSASGNNTGGHGGSTTTKRVGRPSGTKSSSNINRRRKPADYADRGYGKLWEFIRDLLHNKLYCPTMIRWENVDEGVFRIVQSEKLAALWGELKHNPRMTYEKLSRAMRYYYKSKVFLPVLGRRLVYKFGPHAVDWKPENPNFERMDHHLHHIT